jgi:hypothetical protein
MVLAMWETFSFPSSQFAGISIQEWTKLRTVDITKKVLGIRV